MAGLQSACYYDKYDELYPLTGLVNTCDSATPATYTSAVSSILSINCISCHSASRKDGGVQLDTYTATKTIGTSGRLLGAIQHSTGYQAMPPGSKIKDCEIAKISAWLDAGMPE